MSKSEAAVNKDVKLEAGRKGVRLWRNNNGCMYDPEKKLFVRFGLANESPRMNAAIKSADLIGIKPVLITQEMVGRTIGQFVSREVKKSDWKWCGDKRELAQLAWAELINDLGGDACFATGEGTL